MGQHDQQFDTRREWLEHAHEWLRHTEGLAPDHVCFDTKGRICMFGTEVERAWGDDAFPLRWFRINDVIREKLTRGDMASVLRDIVDLVGGVSDEQCSDRMFGSGSTAKHREASRIYASRINEHTDQIADVLERAEKLLQPSAAAEPDPAEPKAAIQEWPPSNTHPPEVDAIRSGAFLDAVEAIRSCLPRDGHHLDAYRMAEEAVLARMRSGL